MLKSLNFLRANGGLMLVNFLLRTYGERTIYQATNVEVTECPDGKLCIRFTLDGIEHAHQMV